MDSSELKNYVASSRKKAGKREVLTVSLPLEMKQKLWDVADRFECDLSIIARAAFQDFLDTQEKREPPLPFKEKQRVD